MEDRNRTAPFPFCGNRFEFRAVGSNQNINFPLAILNTAYAESLGHLASTIESGVNVRDAVANTFRDHAPVIFNGNGYSDEWQVEAAERGLFNLKTSADAYDHFDAEKNLALFESQGVMSNEEVVARKEILMEKYVADVELEATCMLRMVEQGVLPSAAQDLARFEGSGLGSKRKSIYSRVETLADELRAAHASLDSADAPTHHCKNNIIPAMNALREACDEAEEFMDKSLNPFPTYEEILFNLQC